MPASDAPPDGRLLSNGFLPLAALVHPDATAVGTLDLDQAATIAWAEPAVVSLARDQLLLARLHGEPVGIVHVDGSPGAQSRAELIASIWDSAERKIVRHVQRCGCMRAPIDAVDLGAALESEASGDCPGALPASVAGTAAVVVATVGRIDVLKRCLDSLCAMPQGGYEIVVVDNRPAQSATRALIDGYSGSVPIRYVAEPTPGLAIARNAGIEALDGHEFVAFTDDDVKVDRDWLARLLEPFADPRVGAVTGLVLPLSLTSPVQKRFERYSGFGKGVTVEVYDLEEHHADRLLYPYWGGMFGSGNSMAFRLSALRAIDSFDPALGAGTPTGGGEDIAAFTDVVLHGDRIVYQPTSVCWHEHRADEASLKSQVYNYGVGLTAVLWRFLSRDPRFLAAAARSLPLAFRLMRERRDDRAHDGLPGDLSRLELKGRLAGPWCYLVSRRRARRAGASQRFSQ